TRKGLRLFAEYDAALFEQATVARLLHHFEILLQGIVADPEQPLAELPLLSPAERQQMVIDWNQTTTDYPREKCIHQIFEAQTRRAPAATAVVFGQQSLTYRELNARANQLAHFLRQYQIGPDIPVAICLSRSAEMVIAMLAILKAGGAYVPLDLSYPKERLQFMLTDTGAPVLLTEQRALPQVPRHVSQALCLDADWDLIAREPRHNLPNAATAESLAYIMYTSGSTGQPKGVAVPHRAVNRLVLNTNYINLDASDRIAQVSNVSFDPATFDIWAPLLNGC